MLQAATMLQLHSHLRWERIALDLIGRVAIVITVSLITVPIFTRRIPKIATSLAATTPSYWRATWAIGQAVSLQHVSHVHILQGDNGFLLPAICET